jgi:hypothetical protein
MRDGQVVNDTRDVGEQPMRANQVVNDARDVFCGESDA